jgi:hypothetical protein
MSFWTRQQMFDAAYLGLAAQNWVVAYDLYCRYQTSDGRRCAWGQVNKHLTESSHGSASENPGSILAREDYSWANDLQFAHDAASAAAAATEANRRGKYKFLYGDLRGNMEKFARYHGLTIPTLD